MHFDPPALKSAGREGRRGEEFGNVPGVEAGASGVGGWLRLCKVLPGTLGVRKGAMWRKKKSSVWEKAEPQH